ncbi:MAG: tRNA pseudouridine(55) synthase TruB [Armatimonadota bacterium]
MNNLCGFMNVLKPVGCTSHDVVAMVKYAAGGAKTGHTGTLDPAASGVLGIMIGPATKLARYLVDLNKRYRAEFTLGLRTDTHDSEGKVISRAPAPDVTVPQLEGALSSLTGVIEMTPPQHSAVRIGGERAYRLARTGKHADLKPRSVHVYSMKLVRYDDGKYPRATIDIECSKGTYVRSLAQMLGDDLRCGAYMSGLVRQAVGRFDIRYAACLPEIQSSGAGPHLISPKDALDDMPECELSGEDLRRAQHGNAVYCETPLRASQHYKITDGDRLICVAEVMTKDEDTYLQPRTVLRQG